MKFGFGDSVRLPEGWQPDAATLHERVILIAGASGALGRASALACAQAGARVILLGRKLRPLEKLYDEIEAAHPGAAAIYPLDLAGASPRDYEDVAQTIAREYQRLDGVVFAAAHFDGLQPLTDIKPEDWLGAMQVIVNAPFLLLQACAGVLGAPTATPDDVPARAAPASIVFVFDDPARTSKAFWGAYGVAKRGLVGLASLLHAEWDHARVHALLPAPMRSMLRRTAYFGENTMELPNADGAAAAVVYLLAPAGAAARGGTLDLRAPP